MIRLRACCATQAPFGLAVTPARCTRRRLSSMKKSTCRRRSQSVSTVKKSHSTIPAACWRKNSRQLTLARLGAGSMPWRRSTFQTLLADSEIPSPTSSPWIRLYPQLGFSAASRRISRRVGASALDLFPPNGRKPTPLNAPDRLQRRDLLGGLVHEYEAA